jgi:hypothetical protein
MVRKHAQFPVDSARGRFSALFIKHYDRGTNPKSAEGKPWNDNRLAQVTKTTREGKSKEYYASPNSIKGWRLRKSFPNDPEPILEAFFGKTPDASTVLKTEREKQRESERQELRAAWTAGWEEKKAERNASTKSDVAGPRQRAADAERAVRAIVDRLGGEGIERKDLVPWLDNWITMATHKLGRRTNEDEALESKFEISLRSRKLVPPDAEAAARMMSAVMSIPSALADALAPMLRDLLINERVSGPCVEAMTGATRGWEIVAFGLSGFLADACAEKLMARPTPNFTIEILEQCLRDESNCGLLDFDAIARANAGPGLTLFPLCWVQRPCDPVNPLSRELAVQRMRTFIVQHEGYNLKRILKDCDSGRDAEYLSGGMVVLKRFAIESGGRGIERVLVGLDREQAQAARFASTLGLLFTSGRPRLGLTRLQQQLLLGAMGDLSDDEIADQLGISSFAVNKRWRTIYASVREHSKLESEILNHPVIGRAVGSMRQRVTAFVRAHPEELRPHQPVDPAPLALSARISP